MYSEHGRLAKPTRLMVGLMLLKQLENLSGERVVEAWTQNPYYQAFCGMTEFQWKLPCDPTDLVYFRERIGREFDWLPLTKRLRRELEAHSKGKLSEYVFCRADGSPYKWRQHLMKILCEGARGEAFQLPRHPALNGLDTGTGGSGHPHDSSHPAAQEPDDHDTVSSPVGYYRKCP